MNKTVYVEGMTCGHCKMKVEETLIKLKEIKSAEVDLIEGSVELEMVTEVEDSVLAKQLKEAGYKLK